MIATIVDALAVRKKSWLLATFGFVVTYYGALLLSVVVRFGHWPNYLILHNYVHNLLVIVRSTPSFRDMVSIGLDEWLLELGYMNYDYGHGIAEWSIEIIPAKFLIVLALGALVATNIALLSRGAQFCARTRSWFGAAATGLGAMLVGLTGITMMWVACCAAPSWAVGLALLGIGLSTAFSLQPFGAEIALAGFVVMLGATWLLARRDLSASPRGATAASPLARRNV